MVRLQVHVTPRSGRDEIVGWRGALLYVRVTAPPEDGKANLAVQKVVASAVGIPKSAVSVVRGHTARIKSLELVGVDDADVERAVGKPDASLF